MTSQLEFNFGAPAPGGLDKEAVRRERKRRLDNAWRKTPNGRAAAKRFRMSEAGKLSQQYHNNLPKNKAYALAYSRTPIAQILAHIRKSKKRVQRCLAGKRRHGFKTVSEWERHKRATDHQYLLKRRLRCRIATALLRRNIRKSSRTSELLGCTIKDFVAYIERHFLPGMTWGNRHLWDVDHVVPCWAFDLRREDEQRRCFHFSNLRPLWKRANYQKKHKMPKPRQLPLLSDA